jgi:hypothetical protein
MVLALILWIPCCIMIGIAANRHFERDGVGWFILSVVISPLLAGLFLICAGRKSKGINWKTINWAPQPQSIREPARPSDLFHFVVITGMIVLGMATIGLIGSTMVKSSGQSERLMMTKSVQ